MSAVETNAWRRVAFKDISTNTRIITTPDFADYNNLHVVMLLKRGGTQIANDIYFDGVNSGSKYCRLRRTNNTVSQGASENTVDVRGDEENDRYITFDMENWSGEEKILYGHLMIVGDDVEDQQDIQFGAKYVEKSGQINNISVDARSGNTFGSGSYIAVYASTPNSITDGDTGPIALDADGAVHISDGGNTITVDGTVTANLSGTDNGVLDAIDTVLDTIKVDTEAIETATEATQAAVEKTLYGTALSVNVSSGDHSLGATYEAFYIGVGGDISLDCVTSGANIVFKNVASGQLLPVRANVVNQTGTTATYIVALKA